MTDSLFTVRPATWPQDAETLRAIRSEVFIEEQDVTPEEEWDGLDEQCRHVIAWSQDGQAIGTGRLKPDGQIGRMAVRQAWRGHGVGAAILLELVQEARKQGLDSCYLHAQTHAQGFYERYGFVAHGEIFMDANIPHKSMVRSLK